MPVPSAVVLDDLRAALDDRAVLTGDAAEAFLDPTLRDALPNPSSLAGMEEAAARLADELEREGEPSSSGTQLLKFRL